MREARGRGAVIRPRGLSHALPARALVPAARGIARWLGLGALGVGVAGCAAAQRPRSEAVSLAGVERAYLETRELRDRLDVARYRAASETLEGVDTVTL